MFLEKKISILELFLKDHVTLKIGVMKLKIQLYHHVNKQHIQIENIIWDIIIRIQFHNFTVYFIK